MDTASPESSQSVTRIDMPSREEAIETATALMTGFAERTGLTSDRPEQRYLWTDAFAVCNFLGLARLTGEERYTELALRLVDRVHHVLGRRRVDDPRSGWISGLGDAEGEAHPTRGGLRIGKKLPERRPGEPFDEGLEWERDGQYFHYLTKWMHALDQVSGWTRDPRFNFWARELAEVAHAAFTRGPGARRMVWKMSTDLSRPLVPYMGQHDPLDGFITCTQLEATAAQLSSTAAGPRLEPALSDFAAMLEVGDVHTADPLGLGGLLSDACRVAQLAARGAFEGGSLLEHLLAAAQEGLVLYARRGDCRQPASRRLAFRELGLAIGLFALEPLRKEVEGAQGDRRGALARPELRAHIQALAPQIALGAALVSFWLAPDHRQPRTWSEHRDINEVMLATSLIPEGFLVLAPAE